MKKVANAPIMPATTTSIAMMPMLVAIASGESLLPKHTGQASAARGAASRAPMVNRFFSHMVLLGYLKSFLRWNAAP